MRHFGHGLRSQFCLEGGVDFLNHGSFGAPARAVLQEVECWRSRMEANPDGFLREVLPDALRNAATELGRYIGAAAADVVFAENATTAINAVLRSVDFGAGDEIVISSHTYGAVRQAARYVCARTGARLVEAPVALPVHRADELLELTASALSARTRLIVVDHIASPTGVVWPVAEIAALARAGGAHVLVDGAHAPGQIALDISALGVDWYAGNCHKWLFAARGCAFLWSRREAQAAIHPLAISHAYGRGFTAEFDWTGTRDFSNWLAVGAGIRFLETLGDKAARRYCHDLVTAAAQEMAQAWDTSLAGAPDLHGSMMAIRLPEAWQRAYSATRDGSAQLQSWLLREHRIVVAIMAIDDALWARVSAQVYNAPRDYRRLLDVVRRGP